MSAFGMADMKGQLGFQLAMAHALNGCFRQDIHFGKRNIIAGQRIANMVDGIHGMYPLIQQELHLSHGA